MRDDGFYVLNYFNVTEFGADIHYPRPKTVAKSEGDLWKDPNDWLYGKLPNAALKTPPGLKGLAAGQPYYTWGRAVAMDCGDKPYQQFLLKQARRHLERLPESSGICIDRMDWLRLYNQNADDGQSWFENRPARSLYNSWHDLMGQLLPLVHGAGKVVFVNNHTKRIDLLRNIDGIFDEFAANPASLNETAFLTLKRPALGWTDNESPIRENPDAFFHRFLYMGVFPMAPVIGNDHSLLPSDWVNKQYADYGPMMVAMEGRKWVLSPHAVNVDNPSIAANMFSVAGGYVIPVIASGKQETAGVTIRGVDLAGAAVTVLHPGKAESKAVKAVRSGKGYTVSVPLERGCALLRITQATRK
jgi:hypothetical protein